jgi:hypothetical protein
MGEPKMPRTRSIALVAGALAVLTACPAAAQPAAAPPPGSKYVALGSSFAGGPRITVRQEAPATRCNRNLDNYPHQIAAKHGLVLTDVTCGGGATVAYVLGPWNELKAQVDALAPDTRLVTLTLGHIESRLTAGIGAQACLTSASRAPAGADAAKCNPIPQPPSDDEWTRFEAGLVQIAQEVRRRSPQARFVIVDGPTLIPQAGTCDALSLTEAQADASRAIERRLAQVTARAARAARADLIAASTLTLAHGICAVEPWSAGPFTKDHAPLHPLLGAHTATAEAVGRLIWPQDRP